MKIPSLPACHLSYCSNIHPGENWQDTFASLQRYLPSVKRQVCPSKPFGVGLRLSALAAGELMADSRKLVACKRWFDDNGLYVFTINGFPYGTFHGEKIKENVYLPDWSSKARLVYTQQLATILAALLPENVHGSISTVPVGFKSLFQSKDRIRAATNNLFSWLTFASELEASSGKRVQLALEPEPGCFLEDTRGSVQFFEEEIFSASRLAVVERETITRYLGVCLDTCHAAVMFESPLAMAKALQAANIPIAKVQLTAALKHSLNETIDISVLQSYAEGYYLHQSCLKTHNDAIEFYLDLPETLALLKSKGEVYQELRSHFHVPVFIENLAGVQTTQAELLVFLASMKQEFFSHHYEVETYTFDLLPKEHVNESVSEAISREIRWVLKALA